jgi:hypothetical protein
MKIGFKKRQLNFNLAFGIIWLTYFLFLLIFDEGTRWFDYFLLVMALSYLGIYAYQRKYHYITIKNETININGPLGKKFKLKEIKNVKQFAGDIILETDKKSITINTQYIEPESLANLKTVLNNSKLSLS